MEAPPPPPSDFNPWRIVIPALAALILVFTGVFVFTRNSGQTQTPTDQQLIVDPNSQPVQPSQPATGQAEQGIKANDPATAPSATPTPATAAATPVTGADNTNSQGGATNTNTAPELPSPKPVNSNQAAPTPPKTATPLPKPTELPRPAAQPSSAPGF
jgi:hypothetical protein